MVLFIAIWALLFVENDNKGEGSQLAIFQHLHSNDFNTSDQTITVHSSSIFKSNQNTPSLNKQESHIDSN